MAKTLSDHLLNILEELVPYDFEKFKFKLQNTSLEKDHSRIPRSHVQMARPVKLATLLVTHYGEEYAVRLTLQVLRSINQRLLAEELHRATGQEHSAQESGIDTSAVSSRESKPKSLKEPDGQEGDGQRQSSNGAVDLQSSQPEAGRGPQKKCQSKRRDQKVPEDTQSKLWARGTVAISRRGPLTTQLPGDKDSRVSAQLRRNASSAGRLQGLCNVALGRRESKKFEVYLPSGKKRPKSLEIPISSGEGELPNPETFLIAEESRNANSDSAATPRVALEKGSRNPEHSVVLQELAFGSTPSNAPLSGEKKCTASWEESGTGEPETPEALGKVAGGICHKPSNPELLSSSGRPQDEAACHLCHTQEGDLLGGTCVHSSCSCPIAPGNPKSLASHSPRCSQCQASLANSSRGLSPQPVPHCQRHLKQMQLLFCEDHGEAICLICRLSQEHRGHWVRPIQEAAIEYKEQIQKHLEHLKELRKSGEEQRLQGDKKTENFLKQTESQKQRVRCQLEKLGRFLEQQEQLFMAWLEELGQTIGQARETYGIQVSRDIARLDKLIGELEAKQGQSEWELMQDIGVTLHRARMITIPEPWITPPDMKEKIHLLYQKSEFVEKSMQRFSEIMRSEMETFSVPELIGTQAHAINAILDP